MKKNFHYLNYSRRELNGIAVFFILLTGIYSAPYLYRYLRQTPAADHARFQEEVKTFMASAGTREKSYPVPGFRKPDDSSAELFVFDPNRLPAWQWRRLGFSERQISVIHNYEAKGGRFYTREDLKKIYSISEKQYRRLEKYIVINGSSGSSFARKLPVPQSVRTQRRPLPVVELNAADSSALETVRGIGPVLAARILKFRERLGGFYDILQLKEVYGIDSLRFAGISGQLSVDEQMIRKLYVNKASTDKEIRHPYLNYRQSSALFNYRRQHGNFQSIEDFKKVLALNAEIIRKIEPYISFDP